jgi:Ca2+ transporting ATPase
MAAFNDFVLRLLIVAAIVSLAIGILDDPNEGWIEGAAILIAVVIVVCITASNDYVKEKQFYKLRAESENQMIIVKRDGEVTEVNNKDLVVGDIILFKEGDIFPADCIMMAGYGVQIDESTITGESKILHKEILTLAEGRIDCFLSCGSKVIEGSGEAVVCCVGPMSTVGKSRALMMQEEDEEEENTPLQDKLEETVKHIGLIGLTAAILTFLALLIYDIVEAEEDGEWTTKNWRALLTSLILAITIIVVAIPEGLPLSVTMSLAFSVDQMKKENCFVRQLYACEFMGEATTICSDKTGTITTNKMLVSNAYIAGTTFTSAACDGLSQEVRIKICENIARNSTAHVVHLPDGTLERLGNITECAMLNMVHDWGLKYSGFQETEKEIFRIPFLNKAKFMLTVYEEDDVAKIYIKGAPDVLLNNCTFETTSDGSRVPVTSSTAFTNLIDTYSAGLMRVMLLAYKEMPIKDFKNRADDQALLTDLTLQGILALEDPIRPGVHKSVQTLHKAGITVRLVTGDYLGIAVSIAKQCHILPPDYEFHEDDNIVVDGKIIENILGPVLEEHPSEAELNEAKHLLADCRVIARATPHDKFLLVSALKLFGDVVAVTGDGSNDAPALFKADIGLAMNISGTPLAKMASKIIILDDNFESIVNAVKWGRNIYLSIRKFLQFQLTVNCVALFICFTSAVVLQTSPLTAIQMLWVNLIMDSFAALALATEQPKVKILLSKPISREESMISKEMWVHIVVQSVYQVIVLCFVLYAVPFIFDIEPGWESKDYTHGSSEHFTIFFLTFVFLQLFNEINCRRLSTQDFNMFDNIHRNTLFMIVWVFTLVVQVIIVMFGGKIFGCVPLDVFEFMMAISLSVISLPVSIITKMFLSLAKGSA